MQVFANVCFFLPEHIPKTIFLVRSRGSLFCLAFASLFANTHCHSFFSKIAWTFVELVLQKSDMPEDTLDALMIFYHLLVMTAALIWGTRLYMQAEQLVYLERSSIFLWGLKKLSVLFQEAHVVQVLLQGPKGFIKPPLFSAYFSPSLALKENLRSLLFILLHTQGLEL